MKTTEKEIEKIVERFENLHVPHDAGSGSCNYCEGGIEHEGITTAGRKVIANFIDKELLSLLSSVREEVLDRIENGLEWEQTVQVDKASQKVVGMGKMYLDWDVFKKFRASLRSKKEGE